MDNKTLFIVAPSLKVGGIQRALVVLANYLVEQNFRIYFLTCFNVPVFYELDDRVHWIRHEITKAGASGKIFFYPCLLRFIRQKVRETGVSHVLTFGDVMGPILLAATYGMNLKVYIGDRTSADYAFPLHLRLLKKMLYPTSSGYLAQTTHAAEYRAKEFGDKLNIKVIPNGIRDVRVDDVPRENMILYVGRFAWEKAPERLIKAFSMLHNKGSWQLHMAGDGPMLEDMKNYARELGVADQVVFYGSVKDVDSLYSRAGIFVIPSVLEGFPNALCEAMWAGLPCVCFDSLPYQDIFTNEVDGIAVPAGDIPKLAEKMDELIANKEYRLKIGKAAESIRTRFTTEKAVSSIVDFIY